nr:Ubiquitinol-cytochrome C reductase Fe-S subunit TAT signal [uncultured bacterium]
MSDPASLPRSSGRSRRDFLYIATATVAGVGAAATLIPQDRDKWDAGETSEGIILLHKALRHGIPGTYQIQAAIAAVRAQSATEDDVDFKELRRLYKALLAFEPTPVVQLNYAAVEAKIGGPRAGLALIEPLAGALDQYLWFHTMRGSLLMEMGAMGDARAAFDRALALARTEAERNAIRANIALCESGATMDSPASPASE